MVVWTAGSNWQTALLVHQLCTVCSNDCLHELMCRIQYKSVWYRVFILYVVQECLVQCVYIICSTRGFGTGCLCRILYKSL